MASAPGANMPFLTSLFGRAIGNGRLVVRDWRGSRMAFGPECSSKRCGVKLHDRGLPARLALRPSLALGEAYMDGKLTIEEGDVRTLLDILASNLKGIERHPLRAIGAAAARLLLRNPPSRAQANVHHHYDLSGRLYDLFLDRDRQYSCAYFPTGTETLEQAQSAKKLHLAAKLLLEPGQRVLDIGSGWGGMALELARLADVEVTGITLSGEQLAESRRRAAAEGLAGRVKFELQDYREVSGEFDRIVSVGMFEHVGPAHYRTFFGRLGGVLKRDGVAVVHSIGRRTPPGGSDPWISRYIFPGGYVPALSEVMHAVEKSGLWVTDIEILRLHYAETLHQWYVRFQRRRHEAHALYGERFCRMWEFYLAGCEMLFRRGDLMVFQMQLAHEKDAVPLTRDYIGEFERRGGRTTLP